MRLYADGRLGRPGHTTPRIQTRWPTELQTMGDVRMMSSPWRTQQLPAVFPTRDVQSVCERLIHTCEEAQRRCQMWQASGWPFPVRRTPAQASAIALGYRGAPAATLTRFCGPFRGNWEGFCCTQEAGNLCGARWMTPVTRSASGRVGEGLSGHVRGSWAERDSPSLLSGRISRAQTSADENKVPKRGSNEQDARIA